MIKKALAVAALAGIVILPGCHNECCSNGQEDYRREGVTYSDGRIESSKSGVSNTSNTTSDVNYYDNSGNTYVEGTVTNIGPDGRVVLKGYESPYANAYTSYHRDYYSIPETQRETRSREFREKYKDRLNYSEYKDKERDYNFSISNPDRFTVYDESARYGRGADTWHYSTPSKYTYSNIKAGDRVVVGYDSNNPNNPRSMYKVDAQKK